MTFCTADDEIISPYNFTQSEIVPQFEDSAHLYYSVLRRCSFYTRSHVTDLLPFNEEKNVPQPACFYFSSFFSL